MSDFGISSTLLNLSADNHVSAHAADLELGNAAETGTINWELAWIDIGGEG